MTQQLISGLEFTQKLQTLWNQSKGSEWNKLAGGYVGEVASLIKVLKEDFKLASLKPEKVKVLRNEDGKEVEENDPDGVVYA